MVRLLALAVPFLLLAGSLPAAPVPRDAGKELYFPTRVGTKWVYSESAGGSFAERITESEERAGRYRVTVKATGLDWKDDDSTTITQYEVSRDGVFTVVWNLERPGDRIICDPPYCWLKLPHKLGEKWGGNPKDKEPQMVAGKVETVKVPAGTFEAIRVDQGPKCIFWYAPGVGCVKRVINASCREMKSFTLPKE